MPNLKHKLSPALQEKVASTLSGLLAARPAALASLERGEEQHCRYRFKGSWQAGERFQIKQYNNGNLYLDASSDGGLRQLAALCDPHGTCGLIALLPSAEALMSSESPLIAMPRGASSVGEGGFQPSYPCTGSDESGKGDYFGPLVSASVLLTASQAKALQALGVCDSKALSAERINTLAPRIVDAIGLDAIAVVELLPPQYNSVYQRYMGEKKNLNNILADVHAKGVGGLLARPSVQTLLEHRPCLMLVDQFGTPRYLQHSFASLLKAGHALHQQPRAEAFVSVAAASIIARYRFVRAMHRLSDEIGVKLPLGAGGTIKKVARQLVQTHGRDVLSQVAKLHFKTTAEVLASC